MGKYYLSLNSISIVARRINAGFFCLSPLSCIMSPLGLPLEIVDTYAIKLLMETMSILLNNNQIGFGQVSAFYF